MAVDGVRIDQAEYTVGIKAGKLKNEIVQRKSPI
jgi:hypothetical protein